MVLEVPVLERSSVGVGSACCFLNQDYDNSLIKETELTVKYVQNATEFLNKTC